MHKNGLFMTKKLWALRRTNQRICVNHGAKVLHSTSNNLKQRLPDQRPAQNYSDIENSTFSMQI